MSKKNNAIRKEINQETETSSSALPDVSPHPDQVARVCIRNGGCFHAMNHTLTKVAWAGPCKDRGRRPVSECVLKLSKNSSNEEQYHSFHHTQVIPNHVDWTSPLCFHISDNSTVIFTRLQNPSYETNTWYLSCEADLSCLIQWFFCLPLSSYWKCHKFVCFVAE